MRRKQIVINPYKERDQVVRIQGTTRVPAGSVGVVARVSKTGSLRILWVQDKDGDKIKEWGTYSPVSDKFVRADSKEGAEASVPVFNLLDDQ